MDWTGGTRRRFATGKNNASLQKQKAHFARARAPLQATSGTHGDSAQSVLKRSSHVSPINRYIPRPASRVICGSEKNERFVSAHPTPPSRAHHYDDGAALLFSMGEYHDNDPNQRHTPADASPLLSDEDQLLLARRRHLLERPNWLGLSTLLPAKSSSSSLREKHLIGRRRKLRKSRVWQQDVRRTSILIPLKPAIGTQDNGSTVFEDKDVHVKIGTDAIATQTQRSGPSQHSRQTSMRHISTNATSLSEESLLPDVEDGFNEFKLVQLNPADDSCSMAYCSVDEMLSLQEGTDLWQQHVPDHAPMIRHNSLDFHRQSEEAEKVITEGRPQGADTTAIIMPPIFGTPDLVDDEDRWRQFLSINPALSSHQSIAAVNSSSLQEAQSDHIHRRSPSFIHAVDENDETRLLLSTPQGAGTQGSILRGHQESTMKARVSTPPSGSLQYRRTVPLPETAQRTREGYAQEENQLWRAFVFGSRSNSVASSQKLESNVARQLSSECIEPVGAPTDALPAFVSSLETSNHSTAGDTQQLAVAPASASHPMLHSNSETTMAFEVRKNIHAGAIRSSKPRRLEMEERTEKDRDERGGPHCSSRSAVKRRRQKVLSVYSLVDSDGFSLH